MYIIIERTQGSYLQTEYHILNETQMKYFIEEKDCEELISFKDFSQNDFSEKLEVALNENDNTQKEYQVLHVWLH